jgi:hypothetical protein
MRTTSFLLSGYLPFDTGIREQGYCAGRKRPTAQLRSQIEPERRLYKLSSEAVSPKIGRLDLIAYLLFGVFVSAATLYAYLYCGTELFHMVNGGSLEQTVQALLCR